MFIMRDEFRKHSREQLLEDLETAQLRLAFYDLRATRADQIEKTYESDEAMQQQVQQMQPHIFATISRYIRKKHLNDFGKRILPIAGQTMKIAASVLLVVYLGISTALAISPTFRMRVMELLIQMTDEYTIVSLREAASIEIPSDWQGEYFPTSLPDGLAPHSVYGNRAAAGIEYMGDDGTWLDFDEHTDASQSLIDTEDADITMTTVHDQSAMLSQKNGVTGVTWAEGGRFFVIMTNIDVDTALQIARSVTRIN